MFVDAGHSATIIETSQARHDRIIHTNSRPHASSHRHRPPSPSIRSASAGIQRTRAASLTGSASLSRPNGVSMTSTTTDSASTVKYSHNKLISSGPTLGFAFSMNRDLGRRLIQNGLPRFVKIDFGDIDPIDWIFDSQAFSSILLTSRAADTCA
jgi:hypothetical protein